MSSSNRGIRRLVFLLVLAAAALLYSGTIHARDQEEGMLLVTDSLMRKAWFDVDQHLNIDDPTIALIPEQLGPDGRNYLKFGFPTSLFALPLYALAWLLPFGAVQSAFLLNPLVTATTAVVIVRIVQALGFDGPTPAITGALYGLGTMALVYARFFGSEPLVGLALALSVLALVRFQQAAAGDAYGMAALAGFALGMGVATRPATAVVVPVLGLWFLWATHRRGDWLRSMLAAALPGLAWLAMVVAYNQLRFGNPFSTGYGSNEAFNAPLLTGLYGQLLSPGKSLFLYSPVLLLGVFGTHRLWRTHRAVVILLLGTATTYLALYSAWFGWWGGVYWGPRHAMPVLVLLVPLIAPVIDAARTHRLTRLAVIALSVFSLVPQLLGGLMDFETYEVALNAEFANGTQLLIFDPRFSPLWHHLVNFRIDDVIWAGGPWWLPTLGVVVLAGLAGLLAANLRRDTPLPYWPLRFPALLAVVVLWALTLWQANRAPNFGPLDGPRAALADVDRLHEPGDVLLSRTGERSLVIMNDLRARIPWYSFDARPTLPEDDVAYHLERVLASANRLWLLTPEPRDLSNPTSQYIEGWLAARAFPVRDTVYGPGARLLRYDLPPDHHWTEANINWGDVLLLRALWFGLAEDHLKVALDWQALASPGNNYSVSAQLLNDTGALVAQHDGWPQDGFAPTGTWRTGDTVIDRLTLDTGTLPAGDYSLWLLVYDSTTGENLIAQSASGDLVGPRYFTGELSITP